MKTIGSILVLCLAFNFGNAQDVTVNADFDRNADFSKYKTFTMVERDDASAQMDRDKDKTGSAYGTQSSTGAVDRDQSAADNVEMEGNATGVQSEQARTEGEMNAQDTEGQMTPENEETASRDHMKSKHKYKVSSADEKKRIKQALKAELESRGLTYTDSEDADLLLDYKIFEGDAEVVMGQDNTYSAWGPAIGDATTEPVTVSDGTVVVSLIDAEEGQVVYQAYVSADDQNITNDENKMKEAASQVFENLDIENGNR